MPVIQPTIQVSGEEDCIILDVRYIDALSAGSTKSIKHFRCPYLSGSAVGAILTAPVLAFKTGNTYAYRRDYNYTGASSLTGSITKWKMEFNDSYSTLYGKPSTHYRVTLPVYPTTSSSYSTLTLGLELDGSNVQTQSELNDIMTNLYAVFESTTDADGLDTLYGVTVTLKYNGDDVVLYQGLKTSSHTPISLCIDKNRSGSYEILP